MADIKQSLGAFGLAKNGRCGGLVYSLKGAGPQGGNSSRLL